MYNYAFRYAVKNLHHQLSTYVIRKLHSYTYIPLCTDCILQDRSR